MKKIIYYNKCEIQFIYKSQSDYYNQLATNLTNLHIP